MVTRYLACAFALIAPLVLGYACKGEEGEVQAEFVTILETLPEDKASNVPVAGRIGFRLDAPIDAASLTNATFFMTDEDGAVVPATVFVGDSPDTAELDPDEPLDVITEYTVTVTTGLTARGATLEEDFVWDFRTLDSAWGDAEWVETINTGTSSRQSVDVDGQLNAHAIWEYDDGTGTAIWANRYTRTDLWGTPEPIDDGNGGAVRPALSVDDAGNAFALWERSTDGGFTANIWSNRYEADQGWGTAALLQTGDLGPARIPAIAADPMGNAIAVWAERNVETNQELVWARRYEPGSDWGEAVIIDDTPDVIVGSVLAVGTDAAGNATVVWSRATLTGDLFWSNRYTMGSGWGTSQLIKDDPNTDARNQRLAVGAGGDAFVVWLQKNPETNWEDIWTTRFSDSSWSIPERIDRYDAASKAGPDIAVDGMGVAHAVWSQADTDFANIYANQYAPGSGWGTPQLIEPPNEEPNDDSDATFPRVDVNTDGNAFVVWTQKFQGWRSVWSNRLDPGTGWMSAEVIETLARTARLPKIAVDDDRHAHAVWLHSVDSGTDWVRTNRFE